MPHSKREESLLSQHRAFVVQFRKETDVEHGLFSGRVEHVVSGKSKRFQSQQELFRFIAEILAELQDDSSE